MLSKALRFGRQASRLPCMVQPALKPQFVFHNDLMLTKRMFSETQVTAAAEDEAEGTSIAELNQRVGADEEFDEKKHMYVLAFPWNFDEVVQEFDTPRQVGSYWDTFIQNTRAVVDFNNLFREFHQACAIPDYAGLEKVCEPRLAKYVAESIKRIHYHGLDVEMANLTVEQPSIKVLRAEVHQNLSVDRSKNAPSIQQYNISSNHDIRGAPWKTYSPKNRELDSRDALSALDSFDTHRPYLVQITCLIESPMKLHVLNQNHSAVLFGSDDTESVKNIVRFEANLRWFDFLNLLPVENKKSIGEWKITDFNNVLNENPLFEDE